MVEKIVKKYYDALKAKKLMGMECLKCGHVSFPPKPTCNKCGNYKKMKMKKLSGKGELKVYTVVNFPGGEFQAKAPYAFGIVKMKEGPLMNTMIKGVDIKDPEAGNNKLPINVKADVMKVGTKRIVVFKPAK